MVTPEVAEETTTETKPDDGREWYVLYTYSGYENKVKANLEHRITSMAMEEKVFEVVVPTEEQVEIRQGQRRTVQRKLLPGYVLVHMILANDSWHVVRHTPGVTSFVGAGSTPTPLPQEEVDSILKPMQEDTPQVRITFETGERVKIIDGPFTEFLGIVDQVSQDRGQAAGARLDVRPGDTGRVGFPPGGKELGSSSAGQYETLCRASPL